VIPAHEHAATFTSAAYLVAWEHLELGAMPIVLHVQADHLDHRAAWAELTDLGLALGNELDPWLVAAFKLVANPPRAVDLRLGLGSTAVRALAVSAGSGGVLAVLTADRLTVRELDHADLAGALVALVPEAPTDPDLRGQFGAAAIDVHGRRRRAADVVDFHGPVDRAVLTARVVALLDELSR